MSDFTGWAPNGPFNDGLCPSRASTASSTKSANGRKSLGSSKSREAVVPCTQKQPLPYPRLRRGWLGRLTNSHASATGRLGLDTASITRGTPATDRTGVGASSRSTRARRWATMTLLSAYLKAHGGQRVARAQQYGEDHGHLFPIQHHGQDQTADGTGDGVPLRWTRQCRATPHGTTPHARGQCGQDKKAEKVCDGGSGVKGQGRRGRGKTTYRQPR